MRWLLAFAAALLLAGCGAATPERAGAPVVPDMPAPAVLAVDEAPPDDVLWFLQEEIGQNVPSVDSSESNSGFSISICEMTSTSGSEPPPPPRQSRPQATGAGQAPVCRA